MREVEIRGVTLGFGAGPSRMVALNDVTINLTCGLFTVVSGPSGSGKTSLLSVVGGMMSPDSGSVFVEGADIAALEGERRSAFRREKIGYVFQSFRLMPALTAEENVRLSLEIRRADNIRRRARDALAIVGLATKIHLKPNQLSGGEQQRVAVARAIAHDPKIVLADEPTASLDAANGLQVTKLLSNLARAKERIVVAVTHDPRVQQFAQRVIRMEDGRIVGDELCV